MENTKENLKENKETFRHRLKKSLLAGLVFSALISVVSAFSMRAQVRNVVITILVTALFVFAGSIIVSIINRKVKETLRKFVSLGYGIIALLVFLCVTITTLAPTILFKPGFDEDSYNKLSQISQMEEIKLQTEDGTFTGWFWKKSSEKAPLVLYFGGNSGNSSKKMMTILQDQNKSGIFKGYNFAYIDYPGYGKSEGITSEESLKKYSIEVYDYFVNRSEVEKIVVMGYSLGTGVANYVASQREVSGLILMAPYADGYDLYNSHLNIFYGPARLLVGYKMRSVKFAEEVKVKPLIMAAREDKVVPYDSAVRLFAGYKKGCDFVTIEGIEHGEFWESEEVQKEISVYLQKLM